jgi:hypothetical protein
MSTDRQLHLKQELISAFPPGNDNAIDWRDPDGPGPLLEAIACVFSDYGADQVDTLRQELSPLSCVQNLPDWERALGVDQTRIALFGTVDQRRAQVLSRLREYGPPTVANVQTIVNGYLRYADPSQLVVVECPRDDLRLAHTYVWTGAQAFGPGAAAVTWTVRDDARVSKAGAQLDLTLTVPELGDLTATLTGPSGAPHPFTRVGRGAVGASAIRLYCKAAAGELVMGTWQLSLNLTAGAGTLTRADLFVEGLGLDEKGFNGLGAAKFYWGVVAEQDKLGAGYDLEAASVAIDRISYARSVGNLILRSDLNNPLPPGDFDPIPDDPNTIPDRVIPG